jgi:DNA polymerase III subunit delta'
MNNLVLDTQTEVQITNFLSQPAHALLLVAPEGAGKSAVAQLIASQLLDAPIASHPYVHVLTPSNGTLSIDDIRSLQHSLQLKTLGAGRDIRRIVIIESAEALTTEAQNALLKSLEEPPADTVIILTTAKARALLPTIVSRTQRINLKLPTLEALQVHFTDYPVSEIERTYNLSGGLPGLMTALLEADETHPLVTAVETAKQWLRASTYERLLLVDGLSKQKDELESLFAGLERVSQAALVQAAHKQQLGALKRWRHILKLTTDTRRDYSRSAQPKLLLTGLMLEL